MFIEFLDQLRCTRPHEDTWLVASFAERDGRFIVTGTLGCPVCHREYPIQNGIAYFGEVAAPAAMDDTEPEDDTAMRAAAFLDARERATLVLAGRWAAAAPAVTALLPLRVFALNPTTNVEESEMIALVMSPDGVPLTPASVDGVALDAATANDAVLASALRALRPGGRLVAPATVPVPASVKELARDQSYWVGETTRTLVTLQRR
jgi:hypothetical protein